MKKSLALAALTIASAVPALAQTAAPAAAAPTPDWTFTSNVGVFSDYRFRGISQTNKYAAIQGGFDIAHKSGFYVGNWNSNVDSAMYNGGNIEMDFYGGYKTTFGDFGLDVGGIYYYYPGSGSAAAPYNYKIDNGELYIAGSWGPLSVKYNYAVTQFFDSAQPDSKGSSYIDFGYSQDLGNNFGINAHYGYQWLRGGAQVTQIDGSTADNISDWKLGGTYSFDGWAFGLTYVATNRNLTAGTAAINTRNISNGTAVFSVAKTF